MKIALATHAEQPICTKPSISEIKVQVCPLVSADLWQIFAVLASRAIALKTLFERRARVCLKSNPSAAQPDKKINRLPTEAEISHLI